MFDQPRSRGRLSRAMIWIAARQKRDRDIRHVNRLPDYLIDDIGLARRDLTSAFRADPRRRGR